MCRSLAAAPSLLRDAEEACTAVLAAEPTNSKAQYRRALARYRLGQPADAAADLEAIPGGAADAAVAALRTQVQAALGRRG